MNWKIHDNEEQRVLSNSFNAARGRQNRYYEVTSYSRNISQEYAFGYYPKSDRRKTDTESERPVRAPSNIKGKKVPVSKTWHPAEMSDSRIRGVAPVGPRYIARSFYQSGDRNE